MSLFSHQECAIGRIIAGHFTLGDVVLINKSLKFWTEILYSFSIPHRLLAQLTAVEVSPGVVDSQGINRAVVFEFWFAKDLAGSNSKGTFHSGNRSPQLRAYLRKRLTSHDKIKNGEAKIYRI